MGSAEDHIGLDQGAAANVAGAKEVAIVEATSQAGLVPGGLHGGLGAIDNPARIHVESGAHQR